MFAIAAVGLAAAAHVAGGERVDLLTALLAVPAITAPMNLLARRRRGPATLLATLAATQLVLHEAFMATAVPGTCHPGAAMPGMPGMTASMHCTPMTTQHGWSTAMLAAHGIATLLTGLLLARGEAAIWTLAQWLSSRAQPEAPHLVLPARPPLLAVDRSHPATPSRTTPIRRRGPPRLAPAT